MSGGVLSKEECPLSFPCYKVRVVVRVVVVVVVYTHATHSPHTLLSVLFHNILLPNRIKPKNYPALYIILPGTVYIFTVI